MMTFSQAVKSFYSNYANFNGRSSRAAYWWVALYCIIVAAVIYLISLPFGVDFQNGSGAGYWIFNILTWIFGLINFIPNLALNWRRMHDIGKGGGWYFIIFVPFIGAIWYLILLLTPGQSGANRFGNPTC